MPEALTRQASSVPGDHAELLSSFAVETFGWVEICEWVSCPGGSVFLSYISNSHVSAAICRTANVKRSLLRAVYGSHDGKQWGHEGQ